MLVPVEEALYTVFNFNFVRPPKAMQLADIDQFPHCAIGFGGVEEQFAFETDRADNQFGKFAYGEFFTCADIDVAVTDLAE